MWVELRCAWREVEVSRLRACAIPFVTEGDCGGGCGEDGGVEGGESGVVAVCVVGSVDDTVTEEVVLGGEGAGEGKCGDGGRDVEA